MTANIAGLKEQMYQDPLFKAGNCHIYPSAIVRVYPLFFEARRMPLDYFM